MIRVLKASSPVKYVAILCLMSISQAFASVSVPKIFGDHMVLQRNMPIPVWGQANPDEKVVVSLGKNSKTAYADKNGKWLVRMSPMEADGRSYVLTIKGENLIQYHDVLIGDVWVCGGQSNMQWQIHQTPFEEQDTTFIRNAPLRLFTVHIETDYVPKHDIDGSGWKTLSNETINQFSAVAYHFGKYLQSELNVPVGLISDNLGATSVETWMSYEALMKFPQFESEVKPVVALGKSFDEINADFEKKKDTWYKKYYYKGEGIEKKWFLPETDVADWDSSEASDNTWEDTDLASHDGAVWFRKKFDLPKDFKGDSLHIGLSQVDDYDIVWVNGHKIGETFGRHNHRNYYAPAKILKPEGNVLIVRIFDAGGIGGFTTSAFWGNPILWGDWKYRKGLSINPEKFPKPTVVNVTPFSSPGVLFNGSIAPLIPFSIKGVIWYQGESNEARACEYRNLFPALIGDWRKHWGQGDFPFLFVQLANFHRESRTPAESNWAELREAQALALELPNTGMAVAIDVGEADDIHPKDKKTVGERLGISAMRVAYDKDKVHSGPVFKNMTIKSSQVIIDFNHIGDGLITKDKYGYIRGFQIAGKDKKFYWAKAYIEHNRVIASSDKVNEPVAVRYAWSDNPGQLDLYNKNGLPAAPFRTDDWRGSTCGEKFDPLSPRF